MVGKRSAVSPGRVDPRPSRFQWCTAGVVAPLVGLGGEHTAVPMAGTVIVLTGLSLAALTA